MRRLTFLTWCFLLAVLPVASRAQVPSGWARVELPAAGTYFWRFVPDTLDRSRPAPLVVFFHGASGNPEAYRSYVRAAAEAAGCIVALPKSRSFSWTPGLDDGVVGAIRDSVGSELPVDGRRVSLAGHSAGGAYAYLLAYASNPSYSAVFTLGASFYPVAAVADPAYKAPIRMYYGSQDLNYTAGPYVSLKQQWERLGIAVEEEIRPGHGHNTWPDATMIDGFRFLVGKEYGTPATNCRPSANRACLQRGRFAVEVGFETPAGPGVGTLSEAVAADSAVFWFFAAENWELLVKVIDGCAVNGHVWVFESAMSDVRYTLTVTDTSTGREVRHTSPGGRAALPVLDTEAFPACPP